MADVQGVRVALRYKGPDVESGTMPAEDVISALQGFAGAYSKIAAQSDPETQHQLRVVAIKTSSFELAIGAAVLIVASDPTVQLKTAGLVYKTTSWIVKTIGVLIDAKRISKGKPLNIKVDGKNNTVLVIGADNGGIVKLEPDQFKILESKALDGDLDKIAAPLKENSVDRVELSVSDQPSPPHGNKQWRARLLPQGRDDHHDYQRD
jgi:predicted regulator of Ras-like GTPase activity (Roadblock/LC7/MglB family)